MNSNVKNPPVRLHPTTRLAVSIRPLALLACAVAAVLPPAARAAPAARAVEIRLLAFHARQATREAYVHDPDAPAAAASVKAPIMSYLNHEFASIPLSGQRLVITSKPERESLAREADVLGRATLPAGVASAILLLLPDQAAGSTRFRILTIDDSRRAFPAGSFRVSNLSAQPLRIVLEDQTYEFAPGKTQFIVDPPVHAGQQSAMKAFALRDKGWQRIASSIWPHPGKNRVVQVLFSNPLTDQIELRAFDDVPPRPPAASTPPVADREL